MSDWWQQLVQGIVEDFSDLPDLANAVQIAVRLLVAALLGGVIGYQREKVGKEAGLRTHMLVALGAAVFILVPQQADIADLSRVVQGLITGIGFLGAGTILKLSDQEQIKGLTTAASIWLTAAVGMAAGMGRNATAVLVIVMALVILALLPRFEERINKDAPKPSP
jgi:putative Mg2+ transporter-C (MgtC) family protein